MPLGLHVCLKTLVPFSPNLALASKKEKKKSEPFCCVQSEYEHKTSSFGMRGGDKLQTLVLKSISGLARVGKVRSNKYDTVVRLKLRQQNQEQRLRCLRTWSKVAQSGRESMSE